MADACQHSVEPLPPHPLPAGLGAPRGATSLVWGPWGPFRGDLSGRAPEVAPPIAIAAIARPYVATSPRLGRLAGPGRAYGRWPGLPVAEIRPRPDQRTRPPGEVGGPTYLQK